MRFLLPIGGRSAGVAPKLALATGVALAACAGEPGGPGGPGPVAIDSASEARPAGDLPPPVAARPAAHTAEVAPAMPLPPSNPPASVADAAAPARFGTRHAYYEAVPFRDLPGWSADSLGDSWAAFKRSCGVLGARRGWSAPCAAARSIESRDTAHGYVAYPMSDRQLGENCWVLKYTPLPDRASRREARID